MRLCLFLSVLAVTLASFAGCNRGPNVVEVTGTVTCQGHPVPGLTVHFIPEKGRPSWGLTDEKGEYWLHYSKSHDGALVGKHTVWVHFRPKDPGQEARMAAGGGKSLLPNIVEKYGNEKTTPLKFEITKNGQVVDIELK